MTKCRWCAFSVYSDEFDIEVIVAATSTWMRNRVRPDAVQKVIDAYSEVRPNLLLHSPDYLAVEALRAAVTTGQPSYGMSAVGPDKMSPGAERIIQAVDQGLARNDPRPLWVTIWGGANTLAQALLHIRDTRPASGLDAFVSHLRVYSISDQDDAGPWIRRRFPGTLLHRHAVHTRWRRILSRYLDWHQWRSLLPQFRGRGLHYVHNRLGQCQHADERSNGQAVHHALLHSRRRHTVFHRPDQQWPG